MKEVGYREVVGIINDLILKGKKIRVFGLPYPPYKEDIVFTDTRVVHKHYLKTDTGIALDVLGVATKLKIHTLTGWSPIFEKGNGSGIYKLLLSDDNRFVTLKVDDESICPGMLLARMSYKNGMPVMNNEGVISEIEDLVNENDGSDIRKITIMGDDFYTYPFLFKFKDGEEGDLRKDRWAVYDVIL